MEIVLQPQPYAKLKVKLTVAATETRVKYPEGTMEPMMSRITRFASKVAHSCAEAAATNTLRGQVRFDPANDNKMDVVMYANSHNPVRIMSIEEVE